MSNHPVDGSGPEAGIHLLHIFLICLCIFLHSSSPSVGTEHATHVSSHRECLLIPWSTEHHEDARHLGCGTIGRHSPVESSEDVEDCRDKERDWSARVHALGVGATVDPARDYCAQAGNPLNCDRQAKNNYQLIVDTRVT